MRLSKIKLAGFKSFVDPTTIPFPTNLTGIVGPNGCGKSNTIDAVRWVMGESSAKHLRGDSMADVIFNGSTGRKPVGQASIELVFDNSDSTLGGEYAKFNEISIKRVVSRDGQSSYFLNGTRCRRRDITDIFLGTGLGPRSYAIIEQGTISRLIEAKPEELRIFIEEAAGISKYKERRKETESRIQHTRENLNRLNDVREELEKRLQTLQRQAASAEKYKEYKQEEREVKAGVLALRWRVLNEEAEIKQRALSTLETETEGNIAELRKIEAELEKERERQTEQSETFNGIQAEFYGVGAEVARLEQSLHYAKETKQKQERDLALAEQSREQTTQQLTADEQRAIELEHALQAEGQQLEMASITAENSTQALLEAEEAMHGWQSAWDEFNSRASQQLQQAEVDRTRLQHTEKQIITLRERHAKLQQEHQNCATEQFEEQLSALAMQHETLEVALDELQSRAGATQTELNENRELSRNLTAQLNAARGQAQNLTGRRASLTALQEQALGKKRSTLTTWLAAHGLQDAARLAETIQVEHGWERAVEQVLGLHLEAVCVNDLTEVAEEIATLQQGRLAVIEVNQDQNEPVDDSNISDDKQLLISKITGPAALRSLLQNIYIASSTQEALHICARLAGQASVVTAQGEWFGPQWLRVVRDADEKAGVLEREQELRTLTAAIDDQNILIEELDEQLQTCTERITALESERDKSQAKINETARSLSQLQSQSAALQARTEQLQLRRQRLENDMHDLTRQLQAEERNYNEVRQRLNHVLGQIEQDASQREELTKQRDRERSRLDECRHRARHEQNLTHQLALKISSLQTQLQAMQENKQRLGVQLQHLQQRCEELILSLQNNREPLRALHEQLEQWLRKRQEVEALLAAARRNLEEIDYSLRQRHQQRLVIEQKVAESRGQLEQLRINWQEIKVRKQTLEEQLAETGKALGDLLEQLSAGASEQEWLERLARVEKQIARLGAINLAAIEEHAEHAERKAYLDSQYNDLTEALTTLEDAIRKIDRETRTRFKDTFDRVNAGLQAMFPKLFGGGHAYLEMTGEDLLETGITVMARPPGKRNSSIHLLSGGEKALTAVALVFAIFELNPAPFCMLDEVDAPLDEANVGRFCQLVKQMSERVQFIFITHNKATMEMAHQLTGVTMHEPGVSRLVAVDVEEAAKMAAVS